jgi:erythronate-4-phosphate dehydrogenase
MNGMEANSTWAPHIITYAFSVKIIADANIAFVKDAFARLGDVAVLPSQEITTNAVRDADLLLVRSTTKVDASLLEGSRIRFVATATIGTDHLDLPFLSARQIAWASAPGSNADSVLEWLAAALFYACEKRQLDPFSLQIGIVGVGAVGSRIERLCRALGRAPLRCDPPRARREGARDFLPLEALLPACDVVTVHVPLLRTGEHATNLLLDYDRLEMMRPSAILVNASRGEVASGAAILSSLKRGQLGAALLDVWEHEPTPDPALVAHALIATPHIAGHSQDGKVAGTEAVYRAACQFLGTAPVWSREQAAMAERPSEISLSSERDDIALLRDVLERFYRIEEDDAALRKIVANSPPERGPAFRRHREHYPNRRELSGVRIRLSNRPRVARVLEALGATVLES